MGTVRKIYLRPSTEHFPTKFKVCWSSWAIVFPFKCLALVHGQLVVYSQYSIGVVPGLLLSGWLNQPALATPPVEDILTKAPVDIASGNF